MSQTRTHVSNISRPSGWRKASIDMVNAERHAEAGEKSAVSKTRAFTAVKRVGAHIGLKSSDILLLDTLGAFTKPQDWEDGRRPIVWPSNAYLVEQTGFSLSALKRHARRLAEFGVIAFKDSTNGKRWGRRDSDGVIVEAYGFDLSPLSARAHEFEALWKDVQAERSLCLRLKRQVTVTRRMVRASIEGALSEGLNGPWAHFKDLLEELLQRLPRRKTSSELLLKLLAELTALKDRVDAAYLDGRDPDDETETTLDASTLRSTSVHEMDPKKTNSEPHIPTTKQLNLVISSCLEENEGEVSAPCQEALPQWDRGKTGLQPPSTDLRNPSLKVSTALLACPNFASWAHSLGGHLRNWHDLYRLAGQFRPMIGVTNDTWRQAQEQLGAQSATIAFVLVFEKHCAGEIGSPGGYLRGMVRKAGAGDLHLERSIYGRMSAQAA
ncbi:plasmid replication protein RepC [Fluviibacterium sp. DFM31]|uniref:Plasmid replication protein RepC n=1 Tax=Meridianimarinicoccus marinus TaxID=3231483 RepID=A0ABV3LBD1_9RHOB